MNADIKPVAADPTPEPALSRRILVQRGGALARPSPATPMTQPVATAASWSY